MKTKPRRRDQRSFEEIKSLFEHRSYFVRGQFMEDYHFEDDYRSYYVRYILDNAARIKSSGYLSDLICFTIDHSIFDKGVVRLWWEFLQTSRKAVVLLCALYYFNVCPLSALPKGYAGALRHLVNTHRRYLILNQLYLNLLISDETNEEYCALLFRSLTKTKDSRSILRIIANLHHFKSKKLAGDVKSHVRNMDLDEFGGKAKVVILERIAEA